MPTDRFHVTQILIVGPYFNPVAVFAERRVDFSLPDGSRHLRAPVVHSSLRDFKHRIKPLATSLTTLAEPGHFSVVMSYEHLPRRSKSAKRNSMEITGILRVLPSGHRP